MTLDEIMRAAQERLDALNVEAKPLEDALAKIETERVKLRVVLGTSKAPVPPLPVWINPAPLMPPSFPVPWHEPWTPPIGPFAAGSITVGATSAWS